MVYYGPELGICQWVRFTQYVPLWEAMGIEIRIVHGLRPVVVDGEEGLDPSPFEGADLVVLQRYYPTVQIDGHGEEHTDWITDSLLAWLAEQDVALIWDTDDDFYNRTRWNLLSPEIEASQPQWEAMAAAVDLVTVSTPRLGRLYGHLNPNVRVHRNAVDPARYVSEGPVPASELPVLGYYGVGARMLDLTGAGQNGPKRYGARVLDELRGLTTNVYLGDPDAVGFTIPLWDRVVSRVPILEWPATLAAQGIQIGLAPLTGHDFDLGRSELHWLEWTAIGAACIAQRMGRDGPFDRLGNELRLVNGHQDWLDAIRLLARSADARAELVGRSRERMAAEYDVHTRAAEWADSFRWAVEHTGIGARSRLAA